MRPQDLDALGFDTLLEELARHAASEPGSAACLELRPRTTLDAVRDELTRVGDAASLHEAEPIPLGAFPDIRTSLARATTPGARLEGLDLLEIGVVLERVRTLRAYLRTRSSGRPLLLRIAERLRDLPELSRVLDRAIDEEGNLLDDASPALRSLRNRMRRLRQELESQLSRLFRRPEADRIFADLYVTVRNGRFVVPVRAGSHGAVKGIVQDRSGSGETLFVEPLSAVDSNNELVLVIREAAQEEARIFEELTRAVAGSSAEIGESFVALVELDTIAARVRFAERHGAVCPAIDKPGSGVLLSDARHPLLVLTDRPVTPIDIDLEAERNLLILTGPNTGGKTVGLKTLGLAVLMAQSGIPVLADVGARLPLFDGVWTDIGDRQDVAGDLSTFSGHVGNLADILANTSSASLVLLDEPGMGTDPEDGAALARVLLAELTGRGARVLATTHFQPVKVSALNSGKAVVATVDFDPDNFTPRYRLVYGSVGPSLGLAMARRIGFPEDLLARAEADRGTLARSLAEAVEQLEAERRRYETEARTLREERERVRRQEAETSQLLEELRIRKRKKWASELSEAKRFGEELRSEGRRLLAEARRDPAGAARRVHRAGIDQLERVQRRREEELGEAPGGAASNALPPAVGDEVEVAGRGVRGILVDIAGSRARISRGSVHFEAPMESLRRIGSAPKRAPAGVSVSVRSADDEPDAGQASPPDEINLVGRRVARALADLEVFLDRASLENRSHVRIVHGHGTGALRKAIREYLRDCAYVDAFGDAEDHAGGTGATIVRLR